MKIIKVEPIGKRSGGAFVDREDGSGGFEIVEWNVYPEAKRPLRDARVKAGLSLGDVARERGLTAEQVSGLETGRYTLSEEDWDALMATVLSRPEAAR